MTRIVVTGAAGFIGYHLSEKLLARGDDPAKVLDALSHGLTNKLLHAPTHALNQAEGAERAEVAELISRIYRLNSGE